MDSLKVVFMGTPSFSIPILEQLNIYTKVVGVVSAPDALKGRKMVLTSSPVKEWAINNHIPVITPKVLKNEYQNILDLKPDIIITCAYGQIIPKEILDYPRYGCINIHASILPKYRGASPIRQVIIDGEKETGISLMYMDEGLDTGDIIKIGKVGIDNDDDYETLSNKLSNLGAKMIIDNLPDIINGVNERIKQDETQSSYVGLTLRKDEHLYFNLPAIDVYNRIRAFSPEPLSYFVMDGIEYKVKDAKVVEASGKISTIVDEDKKSFTIMCQDKGICIFMIKPLGKKLMSVLDFKNGYKDKLIGKEVT